MNAHKLSEELLTEAPKAKTAKSRP
jgi:hypothetical protein